MALDYSSMADRIVNEIGGLKGSTDQQSASREFIEALCKGIIKEIQENGVVETDGIGNDGNNVHSTGKLN